ncbi:MAG: hypothetical protein ABW003_06665 [Microvirga sp.]
MKNLSAYMTFRNVVGYAAFVCLLLALTIAYVMRADKVYSSNALVLVRADLYNNDPAKNADARGGDRTARAQIPLFSSEDVIRSAIAEIGIAKLFTEDALRSSLKPEDQAYVLARRALEVELEPQTDLIRVSFRHNDPATAAEFVRVLVNKFSDRYYEIYQNAGTVTFFQEQKDQAAGEFAQASSKLAKYAADNQVYRIEEQQRLLLAQRSKVASALSATQGAIEQKRAEKSSIPKQLSQMRVVGRLPQVTGLTQQTPPAAQGQNSSSAQSGAAAQALTNKADGDRIDRLATDPPVLLIKVYQDTIASLVKLHTDLDGLIALEQNQASQIKTLDTNLNGLADQAAEFEKLKLASDAASQRVKAYTKRALDEQLSHAMNTNKLSSIQIVQSPTIPFKPIWPVPVLLFAAAFALCLLPISGVVAYEVVKAAAPKPQVTRTLAAFAGTATKPIAVSTDKDAALRAARKANG